MEKTLRLPNCKEQAVLDQVQVRLVERAELENFKQLLDAHHYLGSLKEVGQRQPLTLAIGGYVVQALAHFFEASQIVMRIEQLFEILQFGPFHEPYLDLM